MRRITVSICLLLLFFAVSCQKKEKSITAADLLNKDFSCNITFSVEDIEFVSQFVKGESKASITLISPETVEGFCLEKGENDVSLSYKGIGISVSDDKLPFKAASYNILDFYSHDADKYKVETHDDGIYLRLDGDISVYTVFHKETLIPLRTYDQNETFMIVYSDYKLTERTEG